MDISISMIMEVQKYVLLFLISIISVVNAKPRKPERARQTFWGMFDGKCHHNGLYYVDENSFAFCFYGNSYMMPCAPGTRNSEYDSYMVEIGKKKSDLEFCNVNLVAYGYHQHPATRNMIYGRRIENSYSGKLEAFKVPDIYANSIQNYNAPVLKEDYQENLDPQLYEGTNGLRAYEPTNAVKYFEEPTDLQYYKPASYNTNNIQGTYLLKDGQVYSVRNRDTVRNQEPKYPQEIYIEPSQSSDNVLNSYSNPETISYLPHYTVSPKVQDTRILFPKENREYVGQFDRKGRGDSQGQGELTNVKDVDGVKDFIHGLNNQKRLYQNTEEPKQDTIRYNYPYIQREIDSQSKEKSREAQSQDDFTLKLPYYPSPDAIYLKPNSEGQFKAPYIPKNDIDYQRYPIKKFHLKYREPRNK